MFFFGNEERERERKWQSLMQVHFTYDASHPDDTKTKRKKTPKREK